MIVPALKSVRSHTPDTLAPDGAEIRVLLDRPQGASLLSLAEALVKPGERTACVSHKTIEVFCKVSLNPSGDVLRWEAHDAK